MKDPEYQKIHALIVDDSAFARNLGQRILKTAGVSDVLEASNGQLAFEMLRQPTSNVHVVFCDLVMPDMDGVQFLRHVATLPQKPAFVFVSGAGAPLLNTVEAAARARNLRVLGSIQKPFTLDAAQRLLALLGAAAPAENRGPRNAINVTAKDLEIALTEHQILLHFQPKISLESGILEGVEALARWEHPQLGLIPPGMFIGLAEQTGLIAALTDRTITIALKQCSAWSAVGLHLKTSVNLSAHMLDDIDLPQRMADEAAQFGVDPRRIVLEITESGLFKDVADSLEILARLHMKGFLLSIDDFGTGYSSLEQLSRLPFAEMKIDRAFVHKAAENARTRAILESSVSLGRKLGVTVLAEGAETQEDWDTLAKVGVDLVQGYFVAKPMEADLVQPWSVAWEQRQKPAAQ